MNDKVTVPDPAEADIYWSGFSGYATLPGVMFGVAMSAGIMFGVPPLGSLIDAPEHWIAFGCFWLVLLGWLAISIVWVYRAASFVYRLTTTHLYLDYGTLYKPTAAIVLTNVTSVEHEASPLGRMFAVGSVSVACADRPTIRLKGIFRPKLFAEAIRQVSPQLVDRST